jgi:hypothetical protein
VLAGYAGTTPLLGAGLYPGAIGVNTGGSLFIDQYGPVQNYRGVGAPAVQLTNGGTQVSVVNGQYFDLQVPLKKYNFFGRGSYALNDSVSAYGQIQYMNSTSRGRNCAGLRFERARNDDSGTGKRRYQPFDSGRPVDWSAS